MRYSVADVALDPWPFGGDGSSRDALEMRAPVVSWPGAALGSRWTASLYDQVLANRTAHADAAAAERGAAPPARRGAREIAGRAALERPGGPPPRELLDPVVASHEEYVAIGPPSLRPPPGGAEAERPPLFPAPVSLSRRYVATALALAGAVDEAVRALGDAGHTVVSPFAAARALAAAAGTLRDAIGARADAALFGRADAVRSWEELLDELATRTGRAAPEDGAVEDLPPGPAHAPAPRARLSDSPLPLASMAGAARGRGAADGEL